MSIGTLENIAAQLTTLNSNFDKIFKVDKELPKTAEVPDVVEPEKVVAKKATAKKVASKKVAAKKAPATKKGDDLSNITTFKSRLFECADATGIEKVMPLLKQFIKDAGYASSDEIEVSDREEFLKSVKVHFNALAEESAEETTEEEDDGFDI